MVRSRLLLITVLFISYPLVVGLIFQNTVILSLLGILAILILGAAIAPFIRINRSTRTSPYEHAFNFSMHKMEPLIEDKDSDDALFVSRRSERETDKPFYQTLVQELLTLVQHNLITMVDVADQRNQFDEFFMSALAERSYIVARSERQQLRDRIFAEIFGLGPLEKVLKHPAVQKVIINGIHDSIILTSDKVTIPDIVFWSDEHFERILQRLVQQAENVYAERKDTFEGHVDGFAYKYIKNSSLKSSLSVTFSRVDYVSSKIKPLIENKTLSSDAALFLRDAVDSKKNILIVGPIGAGKSGILNMLIDFILPEERIIVLEQRPTLQFELTNDVRLVLPGSERSKQVLQSAIHMAGDRLIVDELDDAIALPFLQSLTQGYKGSLATVAINDAEDLESSIVEVCVKTSSDITDHHIVQSLIANTIDFVVVIERLSDGSRRIIQISSLDLDENGKLLAVPIFKFSENDITDKGAVTGTLLKFEPIPTQ